MQEAIYYALLLFIFIALLFMTSIVTNATKALAQANDEVVTTQAQMSQEQLTNQRVSDLQERLTLVENRIQSAEVSVVDAENLNRVERRIVDQTLTLAEQRANLGSQMLSVFFFSIAIIGSISSLFGFALYKTMMRVINSKVASRTRHEVDHATSEALVTMYREFSYTIFGLYEPVFNEFLDNREAFIDSEKRETQKLKELRAYMGMASKMSDRGMDFFRKEVFRRIESHERRNEFWVTEMSLLNHWAYHETARVLVSRELGAEDRDGHLIRRLLNSANTLLEASVDRRLFSTKGKEQWYQFRHTAGFVKAKLADHDEHVEGIILLNELVRGEAHNDLLEIPPLSWRCEIWDDCKRAGIDLRIPRPS